MRTVSSQALASQFHLNAAQIRKDLAWFGEFGVRGVGYSVEGLAAHLREHPGPRRPDPVAVIGAGNLGQALADYPGFPREGFEPVALFDKRAGEGRAGVARRRPHLPRPPAAVGRAAARASASR